MHPQRNIEAIPMILYGAAVRPDIVEPRIRCSLRRQLNRLIIHVDQGEYTVRQEGRQWE